MGRDNDGFGEFIKNLSDNDEKTSYRKGLKCWV